MSCYDFRDWTAVRDRMPGPDDGPTLRIDGVCTCTGGGHVIELEPDNEGVVEDPELVVFRVVIEEPEVGTTQIVEEPVHYDGPVDDVARAIEIRIPDADDVRVEIEDVT